VVAAGAAAEAVGVVARAVEWTEAVDGERERVVRDAEVHAAAGEVAERDGGGHAEVGVDWAVVRGDALVAVVVAAVVEVFVGSAAAAAVAAAVVEVRVVAAVVGV
jgi:predicted DNA-binding protein with PD1-like motif